MSIFRDLLYGQVWEDERFLASFFATEASSPTYLCIASAGEFATHLALRGANVIAVDTSKAQLALCALKWEASCLEVNERRALLGLVPRDQLIRDANQRHGLLERIVACSRARPVAMAGLTDLGVESLPNEAFYDDWKHLVDAAWGPIGAAKIERLMRVLRKILVTPVLSKKQLGNLLAAETRDERAACVAALQKQFSWRALFATVRTPLVALGGVKRAQAARIRGLDRIEEEWIRVLTEVPLRESRCVSWGLRGQLDEPAFPLWARPIAPGSSCGTIAWVHGDIEALVAQWARREQRASLFDGVYLSNVPDYLSDSVKLFEESTRLCRPGGPVIALRQHGAKDWLSPLRDLVDLSVENLRTMPQWRTEQTAAYADGVVVRRLRV